MSVSPSPLQPAIVLGRRRRIAVTAGLMLGMFLTIVAMVFAMKRSRENARMLFLSSITYLPLLLILMAAARR